MRSIIYLAMIFLVFQFQIYSQQITGKIIDAVDSKPLSGANIFWIGTSVGTASANDGSFNLSIQPTNNTLIVSYIGYKPDTILIGNQKSDLVIKLQRSMTETEKIEVSANRPSLEVDYLGVEHTQRINQKELLKAACCNLSESFETNAAVDVSFTDAVTGVRQIEMLGLSGIYTQSTMENLPYLRGLLSNVGLSFVPGTWINAINVSKGLGTVVNGYESITGQIDIDIHKPFADDEKPLYLNFYGDNDRRYEGNLNYRYQITDRFSFINLLHYSYREHSADINKDNFLDMPKFNSVNLMQRWQYFSENGWEGNFGLEYIKNEKRGGTLDHNLANHKPFYYKSDDELFSVYAKNGYVFHDDHDKSFGLQISYTSYKNNSDYGLRNYFGKQNSFYSNFIYQSYFQEDIHKFRTGVSYNFDEYIESFAYLPFNRKESVPGIFFEYTYSPEHNFTLILGVRNDYHNYYGNMFTPRLHFRYEITHDWILRGVAGRGYRTSNILMDNTAAFISNREIVINSVNDFGFGLSQEKAWNFGISLTHYFIFNYQDATFTIDFYRTTFENIVLPNFDLNPQKIYFTSVDKGAYSNSLQAELNMKLFENLDFRVAYRYLDVRQKLSKNNSSVNEEYTLRPFTSKHRALINVGWTVFKDAEEMDKLLIDFTLNWFDKKRMPDTKLNPAEFRVNEYSPAFMLINSQVTYNLLSNLSLYIGAENLLDFKQENPILSSFDPSSKYFDGSLIWGPVSGRMIYSGLRLSI